MATTASAKRTGTRSTTGRAGRRSSIRERFAWVSPWGRINFVVLAVGLVLLLAGYLLMATAIPEDAANNEGIWNNSAATVVAPIVLTIAYCVVIPFAIFYRPKDENETVDETGA